MSDQWDFYFARVNDKLASLFLDLGVSEVVPDPKRSWLLWTWVYLNEPRDDGLPQSPESSVLHEIEETLAAEAERTRAAQLVGRISTDGRREFYFYGETFIGFEDAVRRGMQVFPQYRWDCGVEQDAEWRHYLDVLYPSPSDWQRMKNRHVIEQLEEHGDPLTQSRLVWHWLYFQSESSRQACFNELSTQGFELVDMSTSDQPETARPFALQIRRVDNVDWDSINDVTLSLVDVAERHAGEYDGWETSVEKEPADG